jgi:phosphatidylinositol alpha-1,6-mannosyltransferase
LGLLAPALRQAGAKRLVAVTHGHEIVWARMPLLRSRLRRVGDAVDVLTDIADFTRARIATALSDAGRAKQKRMAPGVDVDRFRPGVGGAQARARLGITPETPLVVCTARLVARKGQDTLIAAWPEVQALVPGARLVLVGDGSSRKRLEKMVARLGLGDDVTFIGAVPWEDVPAWTDAADVYAGPSRTRRFGTPEGLGIVYLEAAACEKPVIVGRSGGAPEAVLDGVSGFVVDPRNTTEIAERIAFLLKNPDAAAEMGRKGREFVTAGWQWDQIGAQCREYLGLA